MSWFSLKRGKPTVPLPNDGPVLLAGRYRIGDRIGRGAISQVFEGVDMRTGGPVAIKFIPLPPELNPTERREWRARLHREASLSQTLRHPDILAVCDAGLEPSQAWLVMERVHGADLARYTAADRLLPEAVVLQVGARVAAALAHAHARGVVHRDLKPANVLVDFGRGQLKLADFGVAHTNDASITRTGLTLGTPAYMAPELLSGSPSSPASDAYALGVMLYELFTGHRPHEAASLGELLHAMAHQPPEPLATYRPGLPTTVHHAVARLLAPQALSRPKDLLLWSQQMAGIAQLMARISAADAAPSL